MRVCGPEQALDILRNDDIIWCHSMAATPTVLLDALPDVALQRKNLTLLQLHTEGSAHLANPNLSGHLRQRAFFIGGTTRDAVANDLADYVPIFLSEIPKLMRAREQRVDAVLVQVSAPDAHGFCSLGVSVEATKAALQVAHRKIAWVNPCMPRTHGDSFIHISEFDRYFEHEQPVYQHVLAPQTEVSASIGRQVANLIDDGDCLQLGIGAIPDATLSCLHNHRELGVHTEMFSGGILPLIECGAIDNSRKHRHRGRTVTTFAMGSQKLYDFIADNPNVAFLDVEYTNDTSVIRKNEQTVAINSALQVDLSGQVCADSVGTAIYSGVGGQMDFVRGAALAKGGKAIIALPSTARGGSLSRITSLLAPGAGVVTTRAHVHYVVTEYGVANLRLRSIKERAQALINIAHPRFQESLARDFYKDWGLKL